MPPPSQRFAFTGAVEGFYGRVWSPAEREAFIAALAPRGLDAYLFAPKHEPALAADLLAPLDDGTIDRLEALAGCCRAHGVRLYVGLHLEPPLNPADPAHLARLADKARALVRLGVPGLAALFDDLPAVQPQPGPAGSDPFAGSQAAAQAHAFLAAYRAVEAEGQRVDWLVCPGRYTLDPALETEFGTLEPDYLTRLHADLPLAVPWLWTGPRVCSPDVTTADAAAYLGGLERPLVLWDNYPVNDAGMQGELHLAPLAGRSAALPGVVRGYLFNPLLQPALGTVPGATCLAWARGPAGYAPDAAWTEAVDALLPEAAREPFRTLAALTHRDPAGAELPDGAGGDLPQRLRALWTALRGEGPVAADADTTVAALEAAVGDIRTTLPGAMAAEAAPWLDALGLVARLLRAHISGAPAHERAALHTAYAAQPAAVLGPWFAG